MATVKEELQSPVKRQCLNEALRKPKIEQESTPVKPAAPAVQAAAVSPGPAAPAAAKTPEPATRSRPAPTAKGWHQNLKRNPFVFSPSSPTPPRANYLQVEPLTPRHPHPPPPLLVGSQPLTATGLAHAPAEPAMAGPPAETATPRGDTGGTGDIRKRRKGTTPAKAIHDAFAQQSKYLHKHPELARHLKDLSEHDPKCRPIIQEFKKALGECNRGIFDTPFLQGVKKGSW